MVENKGVKIGSLCVKNDGMVTLRKSYHVPLKPLYNKERIHGMSVDIMKISQGVYSIDFSEPKIEERITD